MLELEWIVIVNVFYYNFFSLRKIVYAVFKTNKKIKIIKHMLVIPEEILIVILAVMPFLTCLLHVSIVKVNSKTIVVICHKF